VDMKHDVAFSMISIFLELGSFYPLELSCRICQTCHLVLLTQCFRQENGIHTCMGI
jgi:hypothetical protein